MRFTPVDKKMLDEGDTIACGICGNLLETDEPLYLEDFSQEIVCEPCRDLETAEEAQ